MGEQAFICRFPAFADVISVSCCRITWATKKALIVVAWAWASSSPMKATVSTTVFFANTACLDTYNCHRSRFVQGTGPCRDELIACREDDCLSGGKIDFNRPTTIIAINLLSFSILPPIRTRKYPIHHLQANPTQ